jgi:hypothetical protein
MKDTLPTDGAPEVDLLKDKQEVRAFCDTFELETRRIIAPLHRKDQGVEQYSTNVTQGKVALSYLFVEKVRAFPRGRFHWQRVKLLQQTLVSALPSDLIESRFYTFVEDVLAMAMQLMLDEQDAAKRVVQEADVVHEKAATML